MRHLREEIRSVMILVAFLILRRVNVTVVVLSEGASRFEDVLVVEVVSLTHPRGFE